MTQNIIPEDLLEIEGLYDKLNFKLSEIKKRLRVKSIANIRVIIKSIIPAKKE